MSKPGDAQILGPAVVLEDGTYAVPVSGGLLTEETLRNINLDIANRARIDMHNDLAKKFPAGRVPSLGEVDLTNLRYLRERYDPPQCEFTREEREVLP